MRRFAAAVTAGVFMFAACTGTPGSPHPASSGNPTSTESDPVPLHGRIVFIDLPKVPGQFHVYTIAPDGSGRTQVTTPPTTADDHHPKLSPDGSKILFDREDRIIGDRVMVVNADGTGLRDITHGCTGSCLGDDHPAWSPDGTRIAFERALGPIDQGRSCCVHASIGIWVANADGSQPKQLTQLTRGSGWEDHSPSFSPDGRRLVFMRDGDRPANLDRSSIWTIGVDGKDSHLVYHFPLDRPGGGFNARWSPDGSRILFSDICGFDTCRPAPAFVPQIFTIRPDGTDLQPLTHGSGGGFFPAWSPNGQWIVFLRSVTGSVPGCPEGRSQLDVMRADGTDIRRITMSGADGCELLGNPDWGV